jgi:hypothetical protein
MPPKARWRIGSPAEFLGLKPKDIGEVLKKARIQRDESGAWVADSEAIPGCIGQGVTKRKAITNLREAIETQLGLSGKSGSAFQCRQAKITKRLMVQLGRSVDDLKIPAMAHNKQRVEALHD